MDQFAVALAQVIERISAVPDVVWAAGLASVLTLFGVGRQNKAALVRQEAQLQHDRQERERERRLSAKQEVFLAAIEALAVIQKNYALVGSLSHSVERIVDFNFSEDFSALAKVHFVADLESIKLFEESRKTYIDGLATLLRLRFELESSVSELEAARGRIGSNIEAQSKAIEFINKLPIGSNEQAMFTTHALKKYQELEEENEGLRATEARLTREKVARESELSVAVLQETARFAEPVAMVTAALRAEIDLPLPSREYREIVALANQANLELLKSLLADLRQIGSGQDASSK